MKPISTLKGIEFAYPSRDKKGFIFIIISFIFPAIACFFLIPREFPGLFSILFSFFFLFFYCPFTIYMSLDFFYVSNFIIQNDGIILPMTMLDKIAKRENNLIPYVNIEKIIADNIAITFHLKNKKFLKNKIKLPYLENPYNFSPYSKYPIFQELTKHFPIEFHMERQAY